jgi:hypothetical protein
MLKFYCDYCNTFLTHDCPSVRKMHCYSRKHKENVKTTVKVDGRASSEAVRNDGMMPPIMISAPPLSGVMSSSSW